MQVCRNLLLAQLVHCGEIRSSRPAEKTRRKEPLPSASLGIAPFGRVWQNINVDLGFPRDWPLRDG